MHHGSLSTAQPVYSLAERSNRRNLVIWSFGRLVIDLGYSRRSFDSSSVITFGLLRGRPQKSVNQ
jgi:hypothetical protein